MRQALARRPHILLPGQRNHHYARGVRIPVKPSTVRVYIPRNHHGAKSVFTEEDNSDSLEMFYDDLEPCIVEKGIHGWALHECRYHTVKIEVEAAG